MNVTNRGGKILHYHGLADAVLTSTISAAYYEHVMRSMPLAPNKLEDFYRYFQVSGIDHCAGGIGASATGQQATL